MCMTMNINVGRAGIARKQKLETLEDGTTGVGCADDWLSPTNINQLIEDLDNMVAVLARRVVHGGVEEDSDQTLGFLEISPMLI